MGRAHGACRGPVSYTHLEKYPDLEMVSFGPTLRGVHSPDERLEIATVPKFWKLLTEVLKTRAPELVRGFLEKILAPKQEHTMNVPQRNRKRGQDMELRFSEDTI